MNSRISYEHYTADESRELIYLIDELETVQSNLKDSEFAFDFVPYYKERLQECSLFYEVVEVVQSPLIFKNKYY